MTKRELQPTTTLGDDIKPKAKRSKKNAETDDTSPRACFEAQYPKGISIVKPPEIFDPPIKLEDDGCSTHSKEKHKQKSSKTPRKGKADVKEALTGQTPLRIGTPTITSAADDTSVSDVQVKKVSKSRKKAVSVVDLTSSEEDNGSDEGYAVGNDDNERSKDVQKDSKRSVAVIVAAEPLKKMSSSDSRHNDDISALRGCSDEADIYLINLSKLPLTSAVIPTALQEMVSQWLNHGFDIHDLQDAFQKPNIKEQLILRGATPARLCELSQMLQKADLAEHLARWIQKRVPDPVMLREVCARLTQDPRSKLSPPTGQLLPPPTHLLPKHNGVAAVSPPRPAQHPPNAHGTNPQHQRHHKPANYGHSGQIYNQGHNRPEHTGHTHGSRNSRTPRH